MGWKKGKQGKQGGDKVGHTPIYSPGGGTGKNQPGPENLAGNQWGWPDDECMDIMPGFGKQGG